MRGESSGKRSAAAAKSTSPPRRLPGVRRVEKAATQSGAKVIPVCAVANGTSPPPPCGSVQVFTSAVSGKGRDRRRSPGACQTAPTRSASASRRRLTRLTGQSPARLPMASAAKMRHPQQPWPV